MLLPSHEYLDRLRIPYERRSFPPETPKGASPVAAALGFPEDHMVKTLIFVTDNGERVLVMVAANKSAVSGHLKKAIGSRNIQLASPDIVVKTTGYEVGSIPPFHWQPKGFRSFLDLALMDATVLGVGAGKWGEEILITPQDLQRASNARVVNLTDRGRSVDGALRNS